VNDNFDPNDPDAWPLRLTLSEVAKVLRYRDVDSVRALTDKPVTLGGLPYRREGRRRMVSKADLLAYMNRPADNAKVEPPKVKPTRRKPASTSYRGFLQMTGRAA
jgi:hypothetical protein